ncbi:Mitochondrial sodium/hydrogen exchanger [Pseudozyma hubeiensis]|nr:Mitochondrial sodium/hydrogen exchanger [Pseudozyma hubeiensis]
MAQLPPYLVRIVASMLTQALTRKLATSPLFFRIVDRMIHEIDHMPHRVQGRQVPTYQPPLGMRESEWDQDHGEPHNEPSPFPASAKGGQAGSAAAEGDPNRPKMSFEEAQRQRARMSYQQSQRLAQRDRARAQEQQKAAKDDSVSKELKELQDKLRELRNSKPGSS